MVGLAAATAPQMDRGAGVHARGVLPRELGLDICVEDVLPGAAARGARLGTQQLVEPTRGRSSGCAPLVDVMSSGRHAGTQVTPGVEQVLVDRVAVGAEPDREKINGHLIERDGDEDFSLALG